MPFKDRAADFISNIISIMSVKSTRSVNIEAVSILGEYEARELSPSRTSILMPKDILLNIPAK